MGTYASITCAILLSVLVLDELRDQKYHNLFEGLSLTDHVLIIHFVCLYTFCVNEVSHYKVHFRSSLFNSYLSVDMPYPWYNKAVAICDSIAQKVLFSQCRLLLAFLLWKIFEHYIFIACFYSARGDPLQSASLVLVDQLVWPDILGQ